MNALEKAIQKAGSVRKLGAMIGVSGMAVSNWKTHCKGIVPANRVLAIHQVTGIRPHDLRPDIYPNPTDALPAHREQEA